MQKIKQIVTAIIIIAALFLPSASARACSLALHDWKLIFYLRLPMKAPFLPAAEINAISDVFQPGSIRQIIWVAQHSPLSTFSLAFLNLFPNHEARVPWLPSAPVSSILELAREKQKTENVPLIIGSDENQLQIALFVDQNAGNRCFQLVLMQTGRIRAVHASKTRPWAQETRGMSWFSMVFFQLPLPGRILSLAVYPVFRSRIALIDDHAYAESLVDKDLLMRRPEQIFDPYTFDFPDLPE